MSEWHCFIEHYESLYHEAVEADDAGHAAAAAANRTNIEGPWYVMQGTLYVVELGTETRYRVAKVGEWEASG